MSASRSLALLGCVAALAGCMVLDLIEPSGRSTAFDHEVHVEGEGLDCLTCHLFAEDEEAPGMPALGQCRLCHEEGEEDVLADSLDGSGELVMAHFSTLQEEVVFSHLAHVEAGVACESCHGNVGAMDELPATVAVTMDECVACHTDSGRDDGCAVCHTEVGPDWMPASHGAGWEAAHGSVSRGTCDRAMDRCELCHQESTCVQCHQTTPPRSHTNLWRRRGHGAMADMDRNRCQTCHQPDTCDQCHQETPPLSHRGGWAGSRQNHCVGCHLPVTREQGCGLCHQGTPSHALAPPKPPTHTDGMNCRQCHGLSQPLSHPDNGDDCEACHF